ncbi:4Fe-4S dicluster domain-containing protein [Acanthopleuribacter pedis]|uniref:4Fe-4S dicluster domain-containing protein n=1 Tax=Acanthopleuribacter pedis TaxID=442870 RepID=A0A8J7QIF3_9BACT|nr:4Fe-4S dicluster domain-containing protein [Acanthopleuribacter pedis]MBO1321311.1 4Fe-4S dicluster domain-containing protein [Acanthopleuribacter pedis]
MANRDDQDHNRRGFLGEFFSHFRKGVGNQVDRKLGKMLKAPIRPPGARSELEFLASCTRCGACIQACPYGAIKKKPIEAGLTQSAPHIEPSVQACHLCETMPCIQACDDGALIPTKPEAVDMGTAVVQPEQCLTFDGKVCTLCYDACPYPERALTIGEDFHPRVLDACTGCGLCEQHCPVNPGGIQVYSPTRYRAERVEQDTFFGWIDVDDQPPKR